VSIFWCASLYFCCYCSSLLFPSIPCRRYDFGWYIATDGDSAVDGDICAISALIEDEAADYSVTGGATIGWALTGSGPNSPDGDPCGDIVGVTGGGTVLTVNNFAFNVPVKCTTGNSTGTTLSIPICMSWDNNQQDGCDPETFSPGTPAKCECFSGTVDNIVVIPAGTDAPSPAGTDAPTPGGTDAPTPAPVPVDSHSPSSAPIETDACTPPLFLSPIPEVGYTPGTLVLDFGSDTFNNGAANIKMYFDRVLPDANADELSVEAIVFGNAQCIGQVIANTPGAIFADAYINPTVQVFDLSLFNDGPTSEQILLEFDANLTNFANPFFNQTDFCSNSAGGPPGFNGEYNNETNPTGQYCGLLTYCVEFQSLYCGIKVDFVDVVVEIELDLTLDCDDCSVVTLVRDAPENDGADDQLGDGIKCYVCDDPVDPEYTQGDVIEACFDPVSRLLCCILFLP